jgi:hypothetical protein
MSLDIYRNEDIGLIVNRFYGGKKGTCYQITLHEDFVQLDKKQFSAFVNRLMTVIKNDNGEVNKDEQSI